MLQREHLHQMIYLRPHRNLGKAVLLRQEEACKNMVLDLEVSGINQI
jgi:hypothetical protein